MKEFIKCNDYIFRKKDLTYISRDDHRINIYLVINDEEHTFHEWFDDIEKAKEEYNNIFEQLQEEEMEWTHYTEGVVEESQPQKYKITLKEFWESDIDLAIHCNTEEEAKKLLKAFDKLGKKWQDGDSYLDDNHYKQDVCYDNICDYGYYDSYKKCNYTVYEFGDVDLEN